ncbi:MAG: DUF1611 domain-containing protein, partial [Chloroflexi bacterium]
MRRAHRARRRRRHHSSLDERGRCALRHGEAVRRDRERLVGECAVRASVVRKAAPPLIRDVPSRARAVRARRACPYDRGRGAEDDLAHREASAARGPRRDPDRGLGGPRRVRPAARGRHGDVRRSAPVPRRHRACRGERRRRAGCGRDNDETRRPVPTSRQGSRRRVSDTPRVAILAEGLFSRTTAKTAIGVLRYARYQIVAIVDSTKAGTDAADHVGVGRGVPVVATVDDAIARGADVLLIGTAAAGGRIPDTYRPFLSRALERGVAVWNGLHERVLSDPRLAEAARRGNATVRELREPPRELPIGGHRRPRVGATVVLTVGSDAAVGKMTASLEIVAALRRMGEKAAFVATGQTGIAI